MSNGASRLSLTHKKIYSGVGILQCDVCGRQIIGKSYRVIIERAKMTTCSQCAELGSAYWEPEPKRNKQPLISGVRTTVNIPSKKTFTNIPENVAIIENFGSIIRQAREKLGLSHEDLGRKISERVSVIKKVETEKMVPDEKLAAKLEHTLRVKLLTTIVEPKTTLPVPQTSKTVTLGEIVILKNGKRRRQKVESGYS